MKIAVFFNEKNRDAALAIGKVMHSHSVTVVYFETERIWDKEFTKNPIMLMDQVTHMLFVYSSETSDLSAFVFFAGYCLGRGIRVLILETDREMSLPENCRHLGVALRPESFEEYFASEIVRYHEEDKKNHAKSQLLERGISCYEENFVLIVNSGDIDSVKLFLEAGFDPNLADSKGTPILSLAVRAQYLDMAQLLLESGADVNKISVDRGYSPLMDAVQKGDPAMVSLLLDRGAKTNLKSKDGQTALVVAAGRGDDILAKILIDHGADPTIGDNLGMSAASYAKLFNNEKMLALFNIPRA
jgi:uncharacterized protein